MQPHDIRQTLEIRGLDIQQTQEIRGLEIRDPEIRAQDIQQTQEIRALEIQVKKRVNGINKLHRMATNKIKR